MWHIDAAREKAPLNVESYKNRNNGAVGFSNEQSNGINKQDEQQRQSYQARLDKGLEVLVIHDAFDAVFGFFIVKSSAKAASPNANTAVALDWRQSSSASSDIDSREVVDSST